EQSTTGSHIPLSVPRPMLRVVLGLAALAGVAGLLYVLLKPQARPVFEQVAFHKGRIGGARFAAQAVVYSQAAAAGGFETWLSLAEGPESRSLAYRHAD